MKWTDAQHYCREHHTDLLSVRNPTENQEVQSMVPAGKLAWIGLLGDSWRWSDGGHSLYRYQWQGLVDNLGEGPNCVYIYNRKWSVRSCDTKSMFLCYCKCFICWCKLYIIAINWFVDSQSHFLSKNADLSSSNMMIYCFPLFYIIGNQILSSFGLLTEQKNNKKKLKYITVGCWVDGINTLNKLLVVIVFQTMIHSQLTKTC